MMTPNDDKRRWLPFLGSSEECLPIDRLVRNVEGEFGPEAQSAAAAHLNTCLHCEAELALFREFESPEIRKEEHAEVNAIVAQLRKHSPIPASPPWWKSLWNFKILAPASFALAALMAVFVFVPRTHEPSPGPFTTDDTLRSQRVSVLSPAGNVDVVPDFLKWTPVKAAHTYRVRIFEVDNTPLWDAEVQTASAPLPLSVRKQVVPLKTLNWQVTALDQAGNPLADSGTQSFKLALPSKP